MSSNTTARPRCFIRCGLAAEGFSTAPFGARFPFSTAIPPDRLSAFSTGRITSSFQLRASRTCSHAVASCALYDGFDPADFFLESKQRRSAHCSAQSGAHYNTFDGKYWHFYDGNGRSPTHVTLYRSTTRDFVVQAQVRGNPAIACAVAGREGRNWVQLNGCGGSIDFKESCPDELEGKPENKLRNKPKN